MNISVFDMYRIGIGPSSSHTVGPMRAGRNFISLLRNKHLFPEVEDIKVRLMGSLAATGIGHATDSAVLLGLMGKSPSVIDVDSIRTSKKKIACCSTAASRFPSTTVPTLHLSLLFSILTTPTR